MKLFTFIVSAFFCAQVWATKLTVEDFISDATLMTAKVSPDGKHIATLWNKDDFRYVRVFDMTGEKPKSVGVMGDNIIRPFKLAWANNERLLVSLLVPRSAEKLKRKSETEEDFDIRDYPKYGRILSTDITLKERVQLLNDKSAVRRNRNLSNIHHMLPDDDEHVLMTAVRRERLVQYKVNVLTGKSKSVVSGGKRTRGYINERDGSPRYRYDYLRVAKAVKIYEYINGEDWEHLDTIYFDEDNEHKNSVSLEGLMGIYDDKLVYRKENPDTGFQELVLLELDGEGKANSEDAKHSVLASAENKDIVNVIRSGVDNDVIGYTTLGDVYRSHYFSEKSQALYDSLAVNFEGENFYVESAAEDFSLAVIMSYSHTNPGAYFLYKEETKDLSFFNYPFPKLDIEKLALGSKTTVKARDGLKFRSYMLFPSTFDQSKPYPMVVLPHGGPHARDSMVWDDFAQFIATRGYIVLQPNFRGSSGYGRDFMEAGFGEWGGKMQDDIEDAVNKLVEQNLADKNRICIAGISYGGYAALMGAIKTPELYKCAISINGVTDMKEQLEHFLDKADGNKKVETFLINSYGDLKADADRMKANSPLHQVQKIKVPLLLIAGEEDDVVPYEQTEDLFERMEDLNQPATFITLKETGHNPFYYEQDKEDVYKAVEKFLTEHNPPE